MEAIKVLGLIAFSLLLLGCLWFILEPQADAFVSPVKPYPCVPVDDERCEAPIFPTPGVGMQGAQRTYLPVVGN